MSAHPDVVDALEKARARADAHGGQAILIVLMGDADENGRSRLSVGIGGAPELTGPFAALADNLRETMVAIDPSATVTVNGEIGQ